MFKNLAIFYFHDVGGGQKKLKKNCELYCCYQSLPWQHLWFKTPRIVVAILVFTMLLVMGIQNCFLDLRCFPAFLLSPSWRWKMLSPCKVGNKKFTRNTKKINRFFRFKRKGWDRLVGSIVHPPIGRKNTIYIPLIVLAFVSGLYDTDPTYYQNLKNPLI